MKVYQLLKRIAMIVLLILAVFFVVGSILQAINPAYFYFMNPFSFVLILLIFVLIIVQFFVVNPLSRWNFLIGHGTWGLLVLALLLAVGFEERKDFVLMQNQELQLVKWNMKVSDWKGVSLYLKDFQVNQGRGGEIKDYRAVVEWNHSDKTEKTIRVNHPFKVGFSRLYLLGWGNTIVEWVWNVNGKSIALNFKRSVLKLSQHKTLKILPVGILSNKTMYQWEWKQDGKTVKQGKSLAKHLIAELNLKNVYVEKEKIRKVVRFRLSYQPFHGIAGLLAVCFLVSLAVRLRRRMFPKPEGRKA